MLPLLMSAPVLSAPADADAAALRGAILRASKQAGSRYGMQVSCTDKKGHRAFRLFPGGIAVWMDSKQVRLSEPERSDLLGKLLEYDFASMQPMYGSMAEAEDADAAFRVSCLVEVHIEGLEKSSAQQVDGQQSAELKSLAAALLDRVEPLAAAGLTANDLQDGLEKLAKGVLAPETFMLRLVDLPMDSQSGTGSILRIEAGAASRQAYSPGRELGKQSWVPLADCQLENLATAIRAANLPALPANLWSESHVELEVHVLNRAKAVIAGPFMRLKSKSAGNDQRRFDRLLGSMRALNPEDLAHCPE